MATEGNITECLSRVFIPQYWNEVNVRGAPVDQWREVYRGSEPLSSACSGFVIKYVACYKNTYKLEGKKLEGRSQLLITLF